MSNTMEENIVVDAEKAKPATDVKPLRERTNRKEKIKPLQKVIIRQLPPTMNEEEFLNQVAPLPDNDYFYFVPADWTLGQRASCRAYVNFKHQDDIFIFKEKFDGYVFVDNKGMEYPAIVEFAPFQGLPKNKSRKKDNKANTVETEPHYLSFLETLNEPEGEGKTESKMEYSFQIKEDPSKSITTTPLLEYLAKVKEDRRDDRKRRMEDKRRQREEERQKKRNQVAKGIPKPIAEDVKEDDDMPRAIKSRAADLDRDRPNRDKQTDGRRSERDRGKKTEKNKNSADNERKEKEQREANQRRREMRIAKRIEERQRKKEERKEARGIEENVSGPTKGTTTKDGERDKVKKYSESRKERRLRADDNRDRAGTKTEKKLDKQYENSVEHEDNTSVTQSEASNSALSNTSKNNNAEQAKDDRAARIIRNKDRPTLQIYQPGKRRPNSSVISDQNIDGENAVSKTSSSSTSPLPDDRQWEKERSKGPEKSQTKNRSTNSERGTKCSGNSSSKSNSQSRTSNRGSDNKLEDETTKPGGDKKISRYSERRNRAKGKREAASLDEQMKNIAVAVENNNDCQQVNMPKLWSEADDDDTYFGGHQCIADDEN